MRVSHALETPGFTKLMILSVTIIPAILALVRVLMPPEISADRPSLATSPALLGASCESTPIWIPKAPMFANPQSA